MNEKERELDNSWSTGAFILPLFFLALGRAAGGLMQPAAINHNKRTCKFFPRFIYFYSRLHNGMVYATRPLSPTLLLLLLLFSYRHDASINYSADEQLIMYTTYRVLRREESRCCCTRRYPAGSWRAENIIQSFSFYPLDMRDAMGEKEKRRERESLSNGTFIFCCQSRLRMAGSLLRAPAHRSRCSAVQPTSITHTRTLFLYSALLLDSHCATISWDICCCWPAG